MLLSPLRRDIPCPIIGHNRLITLRLISSLAFSLNNNNSSPFNSRQIPSMQAVMVETEYKVQEISKTNGGEAGTPITIQKQAMKWCG